MPKITSDQVAVLAVIVLPIVLIIVIAVAFANAKYWVYDSASNTCNQTGTKGYLSKDACLQGDARWFCYDHKCNVASPDARLTSSYADCNNTCSGWSCNYDTGVCSQTPGGTMGKDECTSDCRVLNYQCQNGQCVKIPYGGVPLAQCQATCGS